MATAGKLERLWIDAQEWLLRRIDSIRRGSAKGSATAPHLETGLLGERTAYFELRRHGYVIAAQRWTNAQIRGDIDLIAWDGDWLCFIEVKTRSERTCTPAESSIDEEKRITLRSLARTYLRTLPEQERSTVPVRFDVVSVYQPQEVPEIEIFRSAFDWK